MRVGDPTLARTLLGAGVTTTADEGNGHGDHRILVIEDDETVGQIVEILLEDEGYAVETHRWGYGGLAAAAATQPTAIVLDLALPDFRGQQVLHDLKSDPATRFIPVIVLSAFTQNLTADEHLLVHTVVEKPFDASELLAALDRAVRAPVWW